MIVFNNKKIQSMEFKWRHHYQNTKFDYAMYNGVPIFHRQPSKYLIFEIMDSTTSTIVLSYHHRYNQLVWYSYDNQNWNILQSGTTYTLDNTKPRIYLYAHLTGYDTTTFSFTILGKVKCIGDMSAIFTYIGSYDTGVDNMFRGCTGLIIPPDFQTFMIPMGTFQDCTNLIQTPMHCNGVGSYAFANCSNLKYILFPINVKNRINRNIFENCVSLETVPWIRTEKFVKTAISSSLNATEMFKGCTALKTIYIDTIDINEPNWLSGVSTNGTIYTNATLTHPRSSSTIPEGWTIKPLPATVGTIISVDIYGNGNNQQFRIIKYDGTKQRAKVIALNSIHTSTYGANPHFTNSYIDTYLNTTWYNQLSTTMQNAIVTVPFDKDVWFESGFDGVTGYYGETIPGDISYRLDSTTIYDEMGQEYITQKIYLPLIDDIITYLQDKMVTTDAQIQNYNVWKMLWNDEVSHTSEEDNLWLVSSMRYKNHGDLDDQCIVVGKNGKIGERVTDLDAVGGIRPTMYLDLSKIDYEIVE